MDAATKQEAEAAQRVAGTLRNITTQMQGEMSAWDTLAEASVATLGRLHGILERIEAVRAAGGAHGDTSCAVPGAASPETTCSTDGGVGRGDTPSQTTGSKDARDAWGPLARFRDLPQALHVALLRSAEQLAVKLRSDLDAFARIEGNIAALCAKVRGSYRRHRPKLGLVAPSQGTATGVATLDYVEWTTRLGRVYAGQLDAKHNLVHARQLGTVLGVSKAMDEWEALVVAHYPQMHRWLEMMTYSGTAQNGSGTFTIR